MKVLLVGNGGREHALAWRLRRSSAVTDILCPGANPGIATVARALPPVTGGNDRWLELCRTEKPDLVVVGPEAPLAAGLADVLTAAGWPVFGPVQAGARLESSKAFAKEVMTAAGVPTARAQSFTDAKRAKAFAAELGLPVVIKADGLAAGKGVTVATTRAEADQAIDENLLGRRFGESSASVLVEEFMPGEEASVFGLCDGETVFPLVAAQDHKRIFDNDEGPNTGGMGAYAPAPVATAEVMRITVERVFKPTLAELKRRGIIYRGVLYAGLMIGPDGSVRIVEFNCRFGDPETQVVLPLVEGDFAELLLACAEGRLAELVAKGGIRTAPMAALTVVLASGGYPGDFSKGHPISGLEAFANEPNRVVFHAGTALDSQGRVVTAGGRVLACTAWDSSLASARSLAYEMVGKIDFAGKHSRTDIAHRALEPRR